MKQLTLILLLVPSFIFSQFKDDFNDGNFTSSPAWTGDSDNFTVDSQKKLKLNATEEGISYLYTNSELSNNALWKFRISYDFNPSSNNYSRIYLASESSDFENSKSIFLDIGRNTDKIELFYSDGINKTLILKSDDSFLNYNPVELDITIENINNIWSLKYKSPADNSYITISELYFAIPYFKSSFFGISARYTITRATKFAFDNFSVTEITVVDETPPNISRIEISNMDETEIVFTEKVFPFTKEQIVITPDVVIDNISTEDSVSFKLSHIENLISGNEYNFSLSNISDINNNILDSYNETILYYLPKENDIVINEIMFDPSPSINLPETEYIELYNNSNGKVRTDQWTLTIGTKKHTLPGYTLEKDHYLIITSDSIAYQHLSHIFIDFTSLNNTGTLIKINTDNNLLINQVEYNVNWINNPEKKDGGWSIELINPDNNCIKKENWIASINTDGGSPGLINSVYNKNHFPEIENQISEVSTNDSLTKISILYTNFTNDNSPNIETNYTENFIINSFNKPDGTSEIKISLNGNPINNLTYFLVGDLESCNNDEIKSDTIWIANFHPADKDDLVINEIMFNPKVNSDEFIEIYNNSDKYINMRNFYISNFSNPDENSDYNNLKKITERNILFAPRSYFVITKNAKSIIDNYKSSKRCRFIEIGSLPKMSNDDGNLALLNQAFEFIDKVCYNSNMHINLMRDENRKGISLERIKASNPGLNTNNWTSASQSSGGATPGLQNSSTPKNYTTEIPFAVKPEVFTPNSDGSNDITEIYYTMTKPGFIANVKVFNANGVFIKNIANNYLMGIEGSFIWDGTDINNHINSKGIYVFWIEIFDLEGNVMVYKSTVVLG
ncbi:MAG: lamin tail domain-containing protein [Bacteroidota bacterium]